MRCLGNHRIALAHRAMILFDLLRRGFCSLTLASNNMVRIWGGVRMIRHFLTTPMWRINIS